MERDRLMVLIADKARVAEENLRHIRDLSGSDQLVDWDSALRYADAAEQSVGSLMRSLVDGARINGQTWDHIAQGLGVTRQAAHKRFRHPLPPQD